MTRLLDRLLAHVTVALLFALGLVAAIACGIVYCIGMGKEV